MAAPWYLAPILGALAGGGAGLFSGLASDRLRGKTNAVRAELARLDAFSESLQLAAIALNQGRKLSDEAVDKLIVERRKLGVNLNRLHLFEADAQRVQGGVERLSALVLAIEDANDEPVHGCMPLDMEVDAAELRRSIIRGAGERYLVFAFMGPG